MYPLTNAEAQDLIELVDDRVEILSRLLSEGLDVKQKFQTNMMIKRLEHLRGRLNQC